MNELIPIDTRAIDGQAVKTVNARDLHSFLEVGRDFSNWIKAQIERARLVEGRDFINEIKFAQNGELKNQRVSGARERIDYYLTFDAAKHIGMMSGTEKGYQIRDYFLECERKARNLLAVCHTPAMTQLEAVKIAVAGWEEAEARAITYQAKAETAEAKVEQMTQTVAAFDRIASAEGSLCITDAAKSLQLQPKKLFSWMHENKWLYGRGGASQNIAYQNRIHQGYLEHKITIVMRSDGTEKTVTQVRVTPKGLARLAKEFPVPEGRGNLPEPRR